jgi:predicted transcriptional regulator
MVIKRRYATGAELAVLKVLWSRGALSARAVAEELYPGASASDIATVQKLISRLEHKGLVTRERKAPAHLFRVTVSQEEFAGEQLEAMAEKLSDGSLAPFVMHLVNSRGLSKREREEIRRLLRDQ